MGTVASLLRIIHDGADVNFDHTITWVIQAGYISVMPWNKREAKSGWALKIDFSSSRKNEMAFVLIDNLPQSSVRPQAHAVARAIRAAHFYKKAKTSAGN